MRVLIAPSGFKECLEAEDVAEAIHRGVRRTEPTAAVDVHPVVDGGEGSARQLARATGGELVPVAVTGPTGGPVAAHIALLGPAGPLGAAGTAYVELAAAAGLSLVPRHLRDPGATTSRGVGELIRAALDSGAHRVLLGCGDSGVCDGGAGALRALGARVHDAGGTELPPGGAALARVAGIDLSGLDPRLAEAEIELAVNPNNVLCGQRGVARVFGPQKGAGPQLVEQLDAAMRAWARALAARGAGDLAAVAGGGASGGLGAGLAGALGARLRSRFDVFLPESTLDARVAAADLVITAEGSVDASTAGKVPAEVARRAKRLGTPVIALCGTIGPDAEADLHAGIDAVASILTGPVDLGAAIERAPDLLAGAAARSLRMVMVGRQLPAA
ncbi:glycerate kinase [Salinifilum aidingensis]